MLSLRIHVRILYVYWASIDFNPPLSYFISLVLTALPWPTGHMYDRLTVLTQNILSQSPFAEYESIDL